MTDAEIAAFLKITGIHIRRLSGRTYLVCEKKIWVRSRWQTVDWLDVSLTRDIEGFGKAEFYLGWVTQGFPLPDTNVE